MIPATCCGVVLLHLSLVAFASLPLGMEENDRNLSQSLALEFAKQNTERLIRGFNLSPPKDVNIVEDNHHSTPVGEIVEKPFRFPNIDDPRAAAGNGTSVEDFGHHAGYYSLPNTKAAKMFYLFFESRSQNKAAPVVVWLTGGPGCSSSLALFMENGPFVITRRLTLAWNNFGWDKESNIIYVDQPIGTGFSYTTSSSDFRSTSTQAAVDFYNFLQAFFKEHPEYAKNDFYITGESYAGHYIPAFAAEIKKNKNGIPINMKGIAIGNGMTHPVIQYRANPDFALERKLITKPQYNKLSRSVAECEATAKKCSANTALPCISAYSLCNGAFNELVSLAGRNINIYDVRKKCKGQLCYDFSNVGKFLNQIKVKEALGVGDRQWVPCKPQIRESMLRDEMLNYADGIPALLQDGVKVLIYAGEYDLICNWLGNIRWLEGMKWSNQTEFRLASFTQFVVDGKKFGSTKWQGPLSFLKVYNAGHMVPMDQPKASLEMFKRWMQGKPL